MAWAEAETLPWQCTCISHQSTRLSIRAVGAVDPVAPQRPHRRSLRSPELHHRPRTGISLKRNPAPPATSPSCGQQPLHHPGGPSRSRCAAPASSATTRQGIKNTISSRQPEMSEREHAADPSARCCKPAVGDVDPMAARPRRPPPDNIKQEWRRRRAQAVRAGRDAPPSHRSRWFATVRRLSERYGWLVVRCTDSRASYARRYHL